MPSTRQIDQLRGQLCLPGLTILLKVFHNTIHPRATRQSNLFHLPALSGGGGEQGGQNLPPHIPCSPTSHTFISHLPPFSVLLPSPVNWQSQNTSLTHPFTIWQLSTALYATHVHSYCLTFHDL